MHVSEYVGAAFCYLRGRIRCRRASVGQMSVYPYVTWTIFLTHM